MTKDLTKGRPMPQILSFGIPVLLGYLFQQLYSVVDTAIVGKTLGGAALAAVGSTGSINFLVVGFCCGVCAGFAIPVAQQFGAGNNQELRRYVTGGVWLSAAIALAMTAAMAVSCDTVLTAMNTPADIYRQAYAYIQTIFIGLPAYVLYNFCAGVLRSLGDSRTPLYFLVVSSLTNVGLDLVMVAGLGLGVLGSAVATVCSQALCCLLCGVYIRFRVPLLCLGRRWLVFDRKLLGKTLSYSSASALQQVCLQLGKVIIQSVVNTQGVSVIAAFTAVNRVDDFAYTPQQNIGHAMTTFIAQNKGAGEHGRIKKGFFWGMCIEVAYSLFLLVFIFLGAPGIMGLFAEGKGSGVIGLGTEYLRLIAFLYLLPGFTNGIQGFFRGMGDLKVTLYSTFMNMLGRVVAVILMIQVFHMGFPSLAWANMAGWILMLLFEVPLLVRSLKRQGFSFSRMR